MNNGRFFIEPEAARRAQRHRRSRSSPGCAGKLAAVPGVDAVPAGAAGPERRRPHQPHPVPIHAAGRRPRRTERAGRRKMLAKLQAAAAAADVATDQQTNGATVSLAIDRDQAARFGIQPQLIDDTLYDAFGQRQVTQYFTQLNSYHVVLEVAAGAAGRSGHARQDLRQVAAHRPAGAAVDLRPGTTRSTVSLLSINHQGQFPAVTLSFNLRAGRRAGRGRRGDPARRETAAGHAGDTDRHLPGHGAGVPGVAGRPSRYLIAAALVAVYIILGMLYESYIHPLTILSTLPSAGAGALLFLMLFHKDLSVIAPDRHHAADRHRQEERHHDGRLRHRRPSASRACRRTTRSARPACCASGRS